MDKDFITVTPDSGGSGESTITVECAPNLGAPRTTSLTISAGGITRTISIRQEGISLNLIVASVEGNIFNVTIPF